MSRSIHQTVKQLARENSKAQITPDHPDLLALVQKKRYKRSEVARRKKSSAIPGTTGGVVE